MPRSMSPQWFSPSGQRLRRPPVPAVAPPWSHHPRSSPAPPATPSPNFHPARCTARSSRSRAPCAFSSAMASSALQQSIGLRGRTRLRSPGVSVRSATWLLSGHGPSSTSTAHRAALGGSGRRRRAGPTTERLRTPGREPALLQEAQPRSYPKQSKSSRWPEDGSTSSGHLCATTAPGRPPHQRGLKPLDNTIAIPSAQGPCGRRPRRTGPR